MGGVEKVHSSTDETEKQEIQLNDSLFLRKVERSGRKSSALELALGSNPDTTNHQICDLELVVSPL